MKSTHKIVILFVIGVLLASMGIFSAFLAYSELGNVVLIRNRSVTLITKVNNFLSLMKDVETGERGYVITNDVTYLTPYLTAVATVNADLKELLDMQQLAISHRHLEILVPLVNAKLAIVKSLIDLKRDNELTTEIVRAKSAEGKKLMDTIRAEVASYDHIEDALLIQREASFQSKMNYLFMLMVVGSIATLFVACLIAFLIYKEAQQRATNLIHIESEKMLVALQLKNEELIIATASAKEANVAKSDFLSNISHEIRTPMNAIIGMSYLLMNTALTTHQRDYILKIKSASRHLLNIINDVLDFSKIEAGKLVLESTEFELDKVLETIANLIAEKATAKGIELIFDVAKDVPPLLIGDPIRLGQILINLGTNSVKFTDQGEIDILVNLVEQTEKEVVIKFSVRDTGIGMTQEEIAKLFQRFTQADSSTTRKYGGSGLGLVIAKTLTELMDGQIGVTSELGKGSLFWFTVRLGKGIGQRRKLALSTEMRGKRVLVVDDNDNARIVIVTLLTSMGFKVDEVSSGKQAIEAVQNAASDNSHYEILFLDWQMPVMDGIEVARRIKKLNLNAIPHMLMVTAYGREEVLQEAERAGIENVLIKPVNASMLFDSVMRLFNDIHDIHSDGGGDTVYDNGAALRTDTANGQTATFKQLATIRGAHILLVEDNDLNQEVALELLRSAGFNVDLAENGEIAVAKVRAADYQLVLMDMQMPVMDGVTATIEIRKDPRCKDLPIVAMTANAMKGDRDRCLAAGMNDHVPKPIEPEDLWKAILKWVTPLHPTQTTQTVIGLEDETAVVPVLTPDMTPPLSLVILAENLSRQASVLDTKVALRRLLGKQELYQKLLDMFLAGQKTVVADITDALNKEDWILAERVVHTLRGASANIGATQLPTLLAQLETAIRSHQPRAAVDDFLHQIVQPLQRLIAEIERIVPREQDNPSITEIDHVKLEKLCLTLRTLLSEHDAQANKVTSTNADLLRAAFPNEYALIAENIDAFRYEAALVLLDSALRSLSPTD